jgi:Mn2+/Fe2+ NRAMP family transporter
MSDIKQISYPEPNKVFTEKKSLKKYLKYLLFFGPGAIVASLTIGQGQLILGPQIGAWAGFSLLWLITLNVGSYIIAYVSCRFTMLSGIGIMDLFAIKTKKGWLNWIYIIIMLIFIPIFTATIMTSLGQALNWIFGFGHYLIWGIVFCVIAGIVVIIGRFKLFEISHSIFILVLAVGAIISVLTVIIINNIDIMEIIPNLFTIGQNVPQEFPAWVTSNPDYSSVTKTSIPLYMLAYLGTLTITIITTIGYLGWIKVKKWGIFKDQKDPEDFSNKCFESFKKQGKIDYLPDKSSEIKKSRFLLKPIKIDLVLAFIIVSIVSAAYMIAGAVLLGPAEQLPSDAKLVQEQLIIFEHLAGWLKPLFQISVVFALFGTVYAGFEAATRMLYETSKNLSKRIRGFEYKRFMLYVFMYILVFSIPLAIRMAIDPNFSVLFLLSITLLFIGVIGVIIYGIGVIVISQTVLPTKYRLKTFGILLSIIALIFMSIPLIFLFI